MVVVDKTIRIQKFPGKGGWSFVPIPEVLQDSRKPFGWVTMSGTIDGLKLTKIKLMPMGNGKLFLPINVKIRKLIGKKAGDEVHIVLYKDNSPQTIPQEIIDCLKLESAEVHHRFLDFQDDEKKAYLDWIYDAKTDETKAKRIVQMIDRIKAGLRFHEK
jgi:hypothetical protein